MTLATAAHELMRIPHATDHLELLLKQRSQLQLLGSLSKSGITDTSKAR